MTEAIFTPAVPRNTLAARIDPRLGIDHLPNAPQAVAAGAANAIRAERVAQSGRTFVALAFAIARWKQRRR